MYWDQPKTDQRLAGHKRILHESKRAREVQEKPGKSSPIDVTGGGNSLVLKIVNIW